MKNNKTIVVAGIIRSGLSLTMQILDKGGYSCMGEFPAYEDYEIGNIDFKENVGKAIKLVDTQTQIPPKGDYYVIRLRRDIKQQAKSMIKFMTYLGLDPKSVDQLVLRRSLLNDYKEIDSWVVKQKSYVYVDFEDLIKSPKETVEKIKKTLDIELDENAHTAVLKRDSDNYPGLLELKLFPNG